MRKRFVVALVAALMAAGCVSAVAASDTTPVDCTIEANVLSCPLPEPPAPVTETNTETVTPDPVTVTETATATVNAPSGPENLFGDATPAKPSDADTVKVELGTRFKTAVDGVVTGVRFYKGVGNAGAHTGSLWSGTVRVATVTFTNETDTGWQTAKFATPVIVKAGTEYIASYLAPVGRYAADVGYAWPKVSGNLTGLGSLYKYGGGLPNATFNNSSYYVDVLFIATGNPPPTTAPTTAPTTPATSTAASTTTPPSTTPATTTPATTTIPPPPAGGTVVLGRSFPNEATTGVPAGTNLTPYTGPCTIQQAGYVIDSKTVTCDDLRIFAKNVIIKNSVINNRVYADYNANEGSFTITDSEVRIGNQTGTGIGDAFFTAERVEVTGGSRSIACYAECTVRDSYVHGQWRDPSGRDHESGIRVNTNSHLIHNTIICDAPNVPPDAGCSAAITGYPDFDPVQGNVIENNLIAATIEAGYCAYGGSTAGKPYSGQTKNITFKDNIFRRGDQPGQGGVKQCGFYGPITSFDSNAPGNVWTNNLYDDGAPVPPAN